MRDWIICILVSTSFVLHAQIELKVVTTESSEKVEVNDFKCEEKISDSLFQVKKMLLDLKMDALSDTIANVENYVLEFCARIEWETDFKNRPSSRSECLTTNNLQASLNGKVYIRKELNPNPFLKRMTTYNQGEWLVQKATRITYIGNCTRGVDYEYYYKKK